MSVAEEHLFQTYRPRVLYFVLRHVRDRAVAEEVTQETFAVVLKALREGRVKEEAKLAAYVYGVARNLVRKTQREQSQTTSLGSNPIAARESWANDPEAAMLLEEQRKQVRVALQQMSPADREILDYCFAKAQPLEDVAGELGVSYSAVRKRKSRALERLRKIWFELSQSESR